MKPWPPETVELFPMACAISRHDLWGNAVPMFRELGLPDWAKYAEKVKAEAWGQIQRLPTHYPPTLQAKRRYLAEGFITPIP